MRICSLPSPAMIFSSPAIKNCLGRAKVLPGIEDHRPLGRRNSVYSNFYGTTGLFLSVQCISWPVRITLLSIFVFNMDDPKNICLSWPAKLIMIAVVLNAFVPLRSVVFFSRTMMQDQNGKKRTLTDLPPNTGCCSSKDLF